MSTKANSVTFLLAVDKELEAGLLEWRRQQPDVPNRSEAVRRILRSAVGMERRDGTG